jgi:uncharacterized protein (DUF302 family)
MHYVKKILSMKIKLSNYVLFAFFFGFGAVAYAGENTQHIQPKDLKSFFSVLTYKVRVIDGLTFDDVVILMRQRANKINLKMVGINPLWKDITAVTGKPTPRVEIYSFCDALLARELMDYSFESIIFMPCRIGIAEDSEGKIWLMMLNWNWDWIESMTKTDPMSTQLEKDMQRMINSLKDVIQAGSTGHF